MISEKVKKWIFVSVALIAIGTIGYITVQYYKIVQAYSTVLNATDANTVITNSTASVPDIDPSTFETNDDTGNIDGSDTNNSNKDAVQISAVTFTITATPHVYANADAGTCYDDNQGLIIDSSGTQTPVDSGTVLYGTVDADGNFSQS